MGGVAPDEVPGRDSAGSAGAGSADGEGARGELQLRGPGLLKNFWRNPIATADSHDGEWLRTGVAARVDAEGRIHLV